MEGLGLSVKSTEGLGLLMKALQVFDVGVLPVAAAMRLKIGLILKNAPHFGAKCLGQSLVGLPPLLTRDPSNG